MATSNLSQLAHWPPLSSPGQRPGQRRCRMLPDDDSRHQTRAASPRPRAEPAISMLWSSSNSRYSTPTSSRAAACAACCARPSAELLVAEEGTAGSPARRSCCSGRVRRWRGSIRLRSRRIWAAVARLDPAAGGGRLRAPAPVPLGPARSARDQRRGHFPLPEERLPAVRPPPPLLRGWWRRAAVREAAYPGNFSAWLISRARIVSQWDNPMDHVAIVPISA